MSFGLSCIHGNCFILFKDVDVSSHSHTVNGLKKYTEYSFRVVAYNKHGPGVSTQDVAVRTLSDGESFFLWNTCRAWGPWWPSSKVMGFDDKKIQFKPSSTPFLDFSHLTCLSMLPYV